ncbi:helix-turn-helix transcriptional regulator [Sorangium sp. So ce327]|uniref:hypothetical protein n=1 Tax=Sorangium sp. So ce327 TaxID=3133301 RepID=UPI003F5DC48E
MRFGKDVWRRREAVELTLEQLAERAELTPSHVRTVEMRERAPSCLSTVLAKGRRVPPAKVFGGVQDFRARRPLKPGGDFLGFRRPPTSR